MSGPALPLADAAERPTLADRARAVPRWRWAVGVVAVTGALVSLAAGVGTGLHGLERPGLTAAALTVTIAVNRVYVLVLRQGHVRESLDVAEGSLVALVLLLPPAQAVAVFVLASAVVELPQDRAPVKKVFNIGVRAAAAPCVVLPVALVTSGGGSGLAAGTAAALGAVVYDAVNAGAVAAVVGRNGTPLRERIRELPPRAATAVAAIGSGLAVAATVDRQPWAVAGVLAPLLLVALTTTAGRAAQRDADRLQRILDAADQVRSAPDRAAQEGALRKAAGSLLLWRDVDVRDAPPGPLEHGAPLAVPGRRPRWLVARPRPDSDPWAAWEQQFIESLADAAAAAAAGSERQAELSRQAHHDPLTGLANRRTLDDVLERLTGAARPDFGVLMIDLDGFKQINDVLGHEAGDELLRITALRLTGAVRQGDVVVRLGGDEFVVIVGGGGADSVDRVATAVAESLSRPVSTLGQRLPAIGASIGAAVAPVDGRGPDEVLRAADRRMYAAKARRDPGLRPVVVRLIDRLPAATPPRPRGDVRLVPPAPR